LIFNGFIEKILVLILLGIFVKFVAEELLQGDICEAVKMNVSGDVFLLFFLHLFLKIVVLS
jgi:hypothetical protein